MGASVTTTPTSPPVGLPWSLVSIFFLPAGKSSLTEKGEVTAAAVPARRHRTLELALAWDMPRVYFGSKEKLHLRWVACLQWALAHVPAAPFSLPPGFSTAWGALCHPLPAAVALPAHGGDPLASPCSSTPLH